MENKRIVSQLLEKYGDKVTALELNPEQAAVVVDPSILVEFTKYIKEDDNLHIDYLSSMTAVDYLEEGMELVYHFSSCQHHHKLTVKVKLNREKPEIPTIIENFPGANWFEREAWELFGINIINHPELKTFLLPEDWDEGWPMRRDWDSGKDFVKMPEF